MPEPGRRSRRLRWFRLSLLRRHRDCRRAEFEAAGGFKSGGVDGCIGRKLGISRGGGYTGGGYRKAKRSS